MGNIYPVEKAGLLPGVVSLFASFISFSALYLYGKWHWDLVHIRQAHGVPLSWLTWGLVDGMKIASVCFAFAALTFAIVALKRKRWILGTFAIVLAILCVTTIPILT